MDLQLLAHIFVKMGEQIGAICDAVERKKGVRAIPHNRMKIEAFPLGVVE